MSDPTAFHFIAYLDPGTGSLIVQFLLGAVVGTGVWFRKHVIATVAGLFRFGRKGSGEAPEGDAVKSAAAANGAPASTAGDVPGARQEKRDDVPAATR